MDYESIASKLFGFNLTRDIRHVKLHSIYNPESPWFNRCFNALLKIEYEYIKSLINDIHQKNVTGVFVEFGIYQGAWINRLYDMTEELGCSRNIYGFDSFKGLSKPDPIHDTSFWKEGMYSASKAEVSHNVKADTRDRIKLVEGFFADSLQTDYAQSIKDIAFARIDCDIYQPAKECLSYLSTRLTHGSILVFDDWAHDFTKGEDRAFYEWIDTVPNLEFRYLFSGPWDHLHLRVLHKGKPDIFPDPLPIDFDSH